MEVPAYPHVLKCTKGVVRVPVGALTTVGMIGAVKVFQAFVQACINGKGLKEAETVYVVPFPLNLGCQA